jgi:hypothetical protein
MAGIVKTAGALAFRDYNTDGVSGSGKKKPSKAEIRRTFELVEYFAGTIKAVSATTTAQPGSPADRAIYVLGAVHTGAQWAGFAAGSLAYYETGTGWTEIAPIAGWRVYAVDANLNYQYRAGVWTIEDSAAAVQGPASAVVDGDIALFDTTTGRLIRSYGAAPARFTRVAGTKAQLKTFAPASFDAVFMLCRATPGDRGGGRFYWSSTNHAADVAADTLELFFIAATGTDGSTGCWVRADESDTLTAEWAGALDDDSTDCTAAKAALETMALRLGRKRILWLGGIYRFNSTSTVTSSNVTHECNPYSTYWRFNHTNDGVVLGTNSAFVDGHSIIGASYLQASGTAYAVKVYNAREVELDGFEDSSVRNFLRVGAQYVAITAFANNGAGLVRITTATADPFATGDIMYVNAGGSGVTLTAAGAANGQFTLTKISSTTYDLQGSVFGGTHTAIAITNAVNNGSGAIRITCASDAFAHGKLVNVDLSGAGVTGGTGLFFLNRISSAVYDLRGSTFGGAYTSGGTVKKAGRIAPFCFELTLTMLRQRDLVKFADTHAIDIFGMAGNIIVNGLPSFQCTNVDGSSHAVAGTFGIRWRADTSAFDRFDHINGKMYFRRCYRGLMFDNTRVVSVRMPDCIFDSCNSSYEMKSDAVDDTGGGVQELILARSRNAQDSGGTEHFGVADCSNAALDHVDCDGISGDFEKEAFTFAGAGGATMFRLNGAQLSMRPQSSSYSVIKVSGLVNAIISRCQAKKVSGAGAIDDFVRVLNDHSGSLSVDDMQLEGAAGYVVKILTGGTISRATSDIRLRSLINKTTAANRVSDDAHIASVLDTPWSGGRQWADIAAATGLTAMGAADGDYGNITGSGFTITNFGAARVGMEKTSYFTGANTIVHDGSRIYLPCAKIQTQAGDVMRWRSIGDTGSGAWVLTGFMPASGQLFGLSTSFTPIRQTGFTNPTNIADDAAISLPQFPANDFGHIEIDFSDTEYVTLNWETFSNASLVVRGSSKSANVDLVTPNGTLAGTTGTDGHWSVRITDAGLLYIENRRGAAGNCRCTIVGGGGV